MADIKKTLEELKELDPCFEQKWMFCIKEETLMDVIELLEKQQSTLGITQTAEGISFTATGTAAEGQVRGIMLGKGVMHNYLETELVRRNLMTDEIREIFRKAKKDTEDLTMIQN